MDKKPSFTMREVCLFVTICPHGTTVFTVNVQNPKLIAFLPFTYSVLLPSMLLFLDKYPKINLCWYLLTLKCFKRPSHSTFLDVRLSAQNNELKMKHW